MPNGVLDVIENISIELSTSGSKNGYDYESKILWLTRHVFTIDKVCRERGASSKIK